MIFLNEVGTTGSAEANMVYATVGATGTTASLFGSQQATGASIGKSTLPFVL
jgi:hypothetical protein